MLLYPKNKGYIIACFIAGIAVFALSFAQSSDTLISNGIITARLYMPNGANNFYEGVRFDRSGIIASLDVNGHSYYGNWFINPYKPANNDAVTGPVEAFDPIGYNETRAGGSFVKIGVGVLTRPDDSAYRFSRSYTIVNAGKWDIKKGKDMVKFTHVISDTSCSYNYQKTMRLVDSQLVISHNLKNTGSRTIETSVFDHNFLVMDKQVTGSGIDVNFSFDISAIENRRPEYVKLQGNHLSFLKEINRKFVSFADLTDGKGSDKYDLRVENHNTGAAVHITADRPVAKMAFWSTDKTICPEPFIHIKVEPGQVFSWVITYAYYTCAINKQPLQTFTDEH